MSFITEGGRRLLYKVGEGIVLASANKALSLPAEKKKGAIPELTESNLEALSFGIARLVGRTLSMPEGERRDKDIERKIAQINELIPLAPTVEHRLQLHLGMLYAASGQTVEGLERMYKAISLHQDRTSGEFQYYLGTYFEYHKELPKTLPGDEQGREKYSQIAERLEPLIAAFPEQEHLIRGIMAWVYERSRQVFSAIVQAGKSLKALPKGMDPEFTAYTGGYMSLIEDAMGHIDDHIKRGQKRHVAFELGTIINSTASVASKYRLPVFIEAHQKALNLLVQTVGQENVVFAMSDPQQETSHLN